MLNYSLTSSIDTVSYTHLGYIFTTLCTIKPKSIIALLYWETSPFCLACPLLLLLHRLMQKYRLLKSHNVLPVSYTHLDVYKRQIYYKPFCLLIVIFLLNKYLCLFFSKMCIRDRILHLENNSVRHN